MSDYIEWPFFKLGAMLSDNYADCEVTIYSDSGEYCRGLLQPFDRNRGVVVFTANGDVVINPRDGVDRSAWWFRLRIKERYEAIRKAVDNPHQ